MRLNTKQSSRTAGDAAVTDRAPKHRREDLLGFPLAAGIFTSAPAYRRCR